MSQFFLGFTDLIRGIYWPSLTPYELGEYAAAGTLGALGGVLLVGVLCLRISCKGRKG